MISQATKNKDPRPLYLANASVTIKFHIIVETQVAVAVGSARC